MQFFVMTPNGPMPVGQQGEPRHDGSDKPIPPRVYVAMEYLQRCTSKTAPFVAGGGGSMFGGPPADPTVVDGQRLTDEESNAQASACNLLSMYFAGKLPRSDWDGQNAGEADSGLMQLTIACPKCGGGSDKRQCALCGATGSVMICRADAPIKKAGKK